jgi:protein disulfide-isomerase A6
LAGRVPELDTLASKFFSASGTARDTVYQEALALADTFGVAGKHYFRVMEKVVNGSEAYLEKETKRLASILEKRTMSPAKLDEIKIKANILAAFVAEKAGQVKEEAEDLVKKAEHLVGKSEEDL